MPFISPESILQVKQAVDIHEVVSSYFPLKRKGTNYWACCPFHEEKTPSFTVHPEKQIFKCFGCKKGGDVISFVMEYEKVEYPEAIRMLAERAGIALKYEGGGAPAIGIAAAMGVALGAREIRADSFDAFYEEIEQIAFKLGATRPTAVNLFWALDRMKRAHAAGYRRQELKLRSDFLRHSCRRCSRR